ncbi:hypothetical protein K0T92_01705 [Paenibacillus oenotherae]|uniref:Lipoprotein n=1 Tax=Paenibacillus oenotherae TaxID=1435645 RepID=A0ABS7D108_9BACL|nr:hypothetical protein [Paenibacillus oenotherae]MBW7473456.1 hypothetical protein [Paenibacillus oenotherae]
MRGLKNSTVMLVLAVMAVVLTGCLYPEEQMAQNQKPPKDVIINIQSVVDQYYKETGLLPIKNSEADTPLYEKYVIDFAKLQRMNYLSDIPAAAYEMGGNNYFLIINEETDPVVKLMNLVIYQRVNDIQAAVKKYADASNGQLPKGETAYPDFWRIDYGKLNMKDPNISSLFSGQTLSAMMDAKGNVYLDYGIDVMGAVNKLDAGSKPDSSADLRTLLVEQSEFVPVKSTVYRLVDGEPQAFLE